MSTDLLKLFSLCNHKRLSPQVFTPENDDRPDVPDYLIIFTDGRATDRSLAYRNAKKLKEKGVKIVAIGAGRDKFNFLGQLEEIATSPSDVWMADFDNLNDIVEVIVKDIVNEVCPQPPPDRSKYSVRLQQGRGDDPELYFNMKPLGRAQQVTELSGMNKVSLV